MIKLSIIVPTFNEEKTIEAVVNQLKNELGALNADFEIIIVDDGSTDSTKNIIKKIDGIRLITHPYNKGYGAALKTGIKNANCEWSLFFDADGQHDPSQIKNFLEYANDFDLVAGDRTRSAHQRPLLRKPGLWLLGKLANYLVDYKIPDLNCGMRLVKTEVIKNYLHLMPNSFSFSTTSTLAFLKDKKNVKFMPVEVKPRQKETKSQVKPSDAFRMLMLMFRLIMIFSPLRIFLPVAITLFLFGIVTFAMDIFFSRNLTDSTILILISSILIFFFGLLADQIAAVRRELE